jgi:hypothetical protein
MVHALGLSKSRASREKALERFARAFAPELCTKRTASLHERRWAIPASNACSASRAVR